MADYWLKFYIGDLDDPQIALLPDRLWRRRAELRLFAKELRQDGALPGLSGIAWRLRMQNDLAGLELDLQQLCMGKPPFLMVTPTGYFIPGFKESQAASTDAERKRQERARKKANQPPNQPPTPPAPPDRTPVTICDGHLSERQINRLTDNRLTEIEIEGRKVLLPLHIDDEPWVAEYIWRTTTGQLTYPGTVAATAEMAIIRLMGRYPKPCDLIDYLKHFWDAWNDPDRRTKYGQPYSPINPTWLTDWATTGHIPAIPHQTPLTTQAATPTDIAAELAQEVHR